ncbi:hypothetical protein Desor_5572 [Desulfosporosinus orientis DSM 765]|uniref:Uncharacterized protein n=1 Tax=Desulfosporosinus orientis (strain ATCC 19365 / DSM 765 / NCIMB 8382 / VKM B-1628 / Singapore I) TaxID=768706 RepID=G7WHM4_DESOD|nr:hypothetical protein Desor_5572 [Desulfosporosinus orientis DSM 765]
MDSGPYHTNKFISYIRLSHFEHKCQTPSLKEGI